jgi:hypothetical protein
VHKESNHHPGDRSQIVFEQRSIKLNGEKNSIKIYCQTTIIPTNCKLGNRLMSACVLMEFNLQIQFRINDVLTKTGAGLILNNCLCALKIKCKHSGSFVREKFETNFYEVLLNAFDIYGRFMQMTSMLFALYVYANLHA